MTISEALKKLHKTITGKDATGETIEEVVSELNDNYPAGGGGGSDNDFIITSTLDISDMSIADLSAQTVSQMAAAFVARKNVRLVATDNNAEVTFAADINTYSQDAGDFSGGGGVSFGDTRLYCMVYIDRDGDVYVFPLELSEYALPTPTASDFLKFLRVGRVSDGEGGYVYGYGLDTISTPLIVHGTISNGDFSFTDTTVKDVYDAKTADRAVFLDDTDGYRWNLTGALYFEPSDQYGISFGCLKADPAGTKIIASTIKIGGAAETTTGGSVTESDLTPNA